MLSMFVNVFTQTASEYVMPQLETLLKRSWQSKRPYRNLGKVSRK
jgi:hypothetical protein